MRSPYCPSWQSVSLCCVPSIMPSANRGVIGGSGRSRPQESHSTPTRNQCQSCRETEKKRIQGLHTINLLTSFEVLLYMGIAEARCEPRRHKATDMRATRCLGSAMCDNSQCRRTPHEDGGHPMLHLVWSVVPIARWPASHASRPSSVVASREAWKEAKC